jgi:hypothetical protein
VDTQKVHKATQNQKPTHNEQNTLYLCKFRINLRNFSLNIANQTRNLSEDQSTVVNIDVEGVLYLA